VGRGSLKGEELNAAMDEDVLNRLFEREEGRSTAGLLSLT